MLGGETIPEVNKCKYLGIIFSSDLGWGEHVTDTAGKAWRALHFVMRILRKGSDKSKEIAYKSLVRPVMEYGVACWDPYRLEHNKALEKIQKRALKCCQKNSPLKWDTLTDRRTRIRLCAMFKTYREYRAEENTDMRVKFHILIGLAFILEEDVADAFEDLQETVDDDLLSIFDYVDDNYVKGRRRERGRQLPMFPPGTWNCYQELYKTFQEKLTVTRHGIEGSKS
ncbi:hypothetical protein ANN_03234 [Periplaneta americana]|uniref:Uncharacterized protein n=1 Tax=Periplaneta americana TaxID=6978 RepID=A0ABQ8U046_PERAM|nr:hypothetical protein ANN_03234 [Periplaneta americana]